MCYFYSLNHETLFVGRLKKGNADGGRMIFMLFYNQKHCCILSFDSREHTHSYTHRNYGLFYLMSIIIVIAHSFPT